MTDTNFCTKCGAHLEPGAKFCTECGARTGGGRNWLIPALAGAGVVVLLIIGLAMLGGKDESAPTPDAQPQAESQPAAAPQPGVQFANYTNQRLKFTAQLPSHWQIDKAQSAQNNAIVFSGAKGGEEYQTTINFQVIQRTAGSNLESQAKDVIDQLSKARGFKVLSTRKGALRGNPAVRLLVEYRVPNEKVPFRQEQMIVEHGAYYYWVGYTAPQNLADKYNFVMERVINTFRFLD
jgi:hypothetical protein